MNLNLFQFFRGLLKYFIQMKSAFSTILTLEFLAVTWGILCLFSNIIFLLFNLLEPLFYQNSKCYLNQIYLIFRKLFKCSTTKIILVFAFRWSFQRFCVDDVTDKNVQARVNILKRNKIWELNMLEIPQLMHDKLFSVQHISAFWFTMSRLHKAAFANNFSIWLIQSCFCFSLVALWVMSFL